MAFFRLNGGGLELQGFASGVGVGGYSCMVPNGKWSGITLVEVEVNGGLIPFTG